MTPVELANFLTGEINPLPGWIRAALAEGSAFDPELRLEWEVASGVTEARRAAWEILAPHFAAGERTFAQVHDALTVDEHERLQAFFDGDR